MIAEMLEANSQLSTTGSLTLSLSTCPCSRLPTSGVVTSVSVPGIRVV